MLRFVAKSLLILIFYAQFGYSDLRAEPPSSTEPLLLIVDFSGSMNEKIEGERKIVLAKKAVDDFLKEYPNGAPLGVMLYGHRRSKDCEDIELISPISSDTTTKVSTLRSKLVDLKARGETPIAQALIQSIPYFNSKPGRILLVTDGREECGGDICAAARKLAQNEINLRVDIVGFKLASAERESLSCVTKITGGTYYDASDGDTLRKSINSSADELLKEGRLQVKVTEGGKIVNQFLTVKILSAGKIVQTIDRSPGETRLLPGTYEIIASAGDSGDSDAVGATIREGTTTAISIEIGTGVVSITLTKGKLPLQGRLSAELYRNNKLLAASTENPARFQVRAGSMRLKIGLSSLQTYEVDGLELKAGERLEKTIAVPYADLTLSAQNDKYSPGRNPYPYFQINKNGKYISALSDNPAKFQLLEGDYEVGLVEQGEMHNIQHVSLKAGDNVLVELSN